MSNVRDNRRVVYGDIDDLKHLAIEIFAGMFGFFVGDQILRDRHFGAAGKAPLPRV